MLVLKGNAFYEIDEECMRRKGLKFPEEAEEEPLPRERRSIGAPGSQTAG